MERRSETVKKHVRVASPLLCEISTDSYDPAFQADTITELEAELAKSQKQENAYSEAIDQMQRELEELQEEVVKLKSTASTAPDKPGVYLSCTLERVTHWVFYSAFIDAG